MNVPKEIVMIEALLLKVALLTCCCTGTLPGCDSNGGYREAGAAGAMLLAHMLLLAGDGWLVLLYEDCMLTVGG